MSLTNLSPPPSPSPLIPSPFTPHLPTASRYITDSYNAISEGVIGSTGLDLQEGAAAVGRVKVTVGADFDADEAVAAGGTRVKVSVKPGGNLDEVMVAAPGACIDAHVVGYVWRGERARQEKRVCMCE